MHRFPPHYDGSKISVAGYPQYRSDYEKRQEAEQREREKGKESSRTELSKTEKKLPSHSGSGISTDGQATDHEGKNAHARFHSAGEKV